MILTGWAAAAAQDRKPSDFSDQYKDMLRAVPYDGARTCPSLLLRRCNCSESISQSYTRATSPLANSTPGPVNAEAVFAVILQRIVFRVADGKREGNGVALRPPRSKLIRPQTGQE